MKEFLYINKSLEVGERCDITLDDENEHIEEQDYNPPTHYTHPLQPTHPPTTIHPQIVKLCSQTLGLTKSPATLSLKNVHFFSCISFSVPY